MTPSARGRAHAMTSRRSFLKATSAGALLTGFSARAAKSADYRSELEARDRPTRLPRPHERGSAHAIAHP